MATSRVRTPCFRLIFHPWGRTAGSEPVKALFLVSLELFGIPDYAWHRSAAETLLSPFCKIEHLVLETWSMFDVSVFKLTTWTINPDAIPRSSELLAQDDDAVDLDADPDHTKRFALGLARFPSGSTWPPASTIDARLCHRRQLRTMRPRGRDPPPPRSPYVGPISMIPLPPP